MKLCTLIFKTKSKMGMLIVFKNYAYNKLNQFLKIVLTNVYEIALF